MDVKKRSIWAWALYDWANSAYATTVMAGFFPIFFKTYWANALSPNESTFYLGSANSSAAIIIALLAPFLGAVADRGTAKKRFLAITSFLGICMTLGLWLVAEGKWELAIIFYFLSSIGWTGANIFYDALITGVSTKKNVDYVSSLGFALGYIGGGLLFLLNVLMYLKYDLFGIPDPATAIKISFLTVAIWWAIFSIPLFVFVNEPKIYQPTGIKNSVKLGWKQLVNTLRDIGKYKIVALFLLAYWLYIDGVDTIIRMAVDYGKSLNFTTSTLITALLMVQFIAFPAALAYAKISEKIGTKRAIISGILGYTVITVLGYLMQKEWQFYFLAGMVGLFQGGIQALSRSLFSRIIPHDKSAEFFGFYNMLGKFAAVIGPFLMGSVTLMFGNPRIGILSILILFVSGLAILLKVDVQEGERLALQATNKSD